MNVRNPDKNRYLNALKLVEQDEVSFVETEADFRVVEQVLGRRVPGILRSYDLPPADYVEFVQRLGMDMAYVTVPWKLGRKEILDEDGRSLYIDGTIKTWADLDNIVDPGDDEIKKRLDEMLAAVDGTGIGIIYNHWNTPVVVTTAIGYEDYYIALMTDPDFVRECFKRVDEIRLRQLELILSYPLDAHLITAILAMSSGPIMSDEIVEEFEFPYMKRNMEMIRSTGACVSFHCDGDNRKYFKKMIDMGLQCIQAIDPCGGRQDIYELKEFYGDKVALHGNINCELLMSGTREQIVDDVLEHIRRLNVGGGYVCSSSHDLTEKMPMENIWAMIETIQNTGNDKRSE